MVPFAAVMVDSGLNRLKKLWLQDLPNYHQRAVLCENLDASRRPPRIGAPIFNRRSRLDSAFQQLACFASGCSGKWLHICAAAFALLIVFLLVPLYVLVNNTYLLDFSLSCFMFRFSMEASRATSYTAVRRKRCSFIVGESWCRIFHGHRRLYNGISVVEQSF